MYKIDNSLYSRQIYTIGKDAMEALKCANILITGLNGLGVEIAKNIMSKLENLKLDSFILLV